MCGPNSASGTRRRDRMDAREPHRASSRNETTREAVEDVSSAENDEHDVSMMTEVCMSLVCTPGSGNVSDMHGCFTFQEFTDSCKNEGSAEGNIAVQGESNYTTGRGPARRNKRQRYGRRKDGKN